jgi:ribosome maturation factor RimP
MVNDKDLNTVVEKLADQRGFFIVDIQNKKGKIKVIIDDREGIKLDECVSINREIRSFFGEKLDDHDLEVTSPGLTEPFKVLRQYEKNVGQKVEVMQRDGSKISGKLLSASPDQITLEEKKRIKTENKKKKTIREEHNIPMNEVEQTKLIISF